MRKQVGILCGKFQHLKDHHDDLLLAGFKPGKHDLIAAHVGVQLVGYRFAALYDPENLYDTRLGIHRAGWMGELEKRLAPDCLIDDEPLAIVLHLDGWPD